MRTLETQTLYNKKIAENLAKELAEELAEELKLAKANELLKCNLLINIDMLADLKTLVNSCCVSDTRNKRANLVGDEEGLKMISSYKLVYLHKDNSLEVNVAINAGHLLDAFQAFYDADEASIIVKVSKDNIHMYSPDKKYNASLLALKSN
jgi:hypothetical protein